MTGRARDITVIGAGINGLVAGTPAYMCATELLAELGSE
jgi:hypothetical protein